MKSLKTTLVVLMLVTLGFGCASVTDAGLNDEITQEPTIETPATGSAMFGGNDEMGQSKGERPD